jgi:hypothetical protein
MLGFMSLLLTHGLLRPARLQTAPASAAGARPLKVQANTAAAAHAVGKAETDIDALPL